MSYMKYCVCSHFVLGQANQGRASLQVQPEQTEPSVAKHHAGGQVQGAEERHRDPEPDVRKSCGQKGGRQ